MKNYKPAFPINPGEVYLPASEVSEILSIPESLVIEYLPSIPLHTPGNPFSLRFYAADKKTIIARGLSPNIWRIFKVFRYSYDNPKRDYWLRVLAGLRTKHRMERFQTYYCGFSHEERLNIYKECVRVELTPRLQKRLSRVNEKLHPNEAWALAQKALIACSKECQIEGRNGKSRLYSAARRWLKTNFPKLEV